jgi:hypothetical protein
MKRYFLAFAILAAGLAAMIATVKPAKAQGFCHTEIYCDWTGCHNIVVCR